MNTRHNNMSRVSTIRDIRHNVSVTHSLDAIITLPPTWEKIGVRSLILTIWIYCAPFFLDIQGWFHYIFPSKKQYLISMKIIIPCKPVKWNQRPILIEWCCVRNQWLSEQKQLFWRQALKSWLRHYGLSIADESVDMVFYHPPYWNLARYSDNPKSEPFYFFMLLNFTIGFLHA
jgi:DNA modification methylase